MTGEELQRRRKEVEMSQEDIAEAVGLKGKHRRQTVSSWERGETQITDSMSLLLDVVLSARARIQRRKRGREAPAA